ncbi:lysozyme inhibitor LprI family protein [Oceanicaulis sp. LC35]|uniref:lysozyme inhibitor LprI family protein n=1 Tax=Oceanicaulis sp. LC35 TaxID=3349635 RepID=UPI003F87068C
MLAEGLVLAMTLALNAQGTDQTDLPGRGQLDACLAQAEISEACIGVVSDACQEEPDGYTTYGMRSCMQRETALWDDRLNAAYSALRTRLLNREQTLRRERLLDAQRAWLTYRETECSQQSLAYEGGTMMGVVADSCFNDFTARRAIDLESQLEEIEM